MGTQAPLDAWLRSEGYQHGVDSPPNPSGLKPLMQAARIGDAEIVRALIQAKVDVHCTNDDGNNALWLACYAENIEIIKLLLDAGVSINHQNLSGATCLMFAASTGKEQVLAELLRRGAQKALRTFDDYSAVDLASTEACLRLLRT